MLALKERKTTQHNTTAVNEHTQRDTTTSTVYLASFRLERISQQEKERERERERERDRERGKRKRSTETKKKK